MDRLRCVVDEVRGTGRVADHVEHPDQIILGGFGQLLPEEVAGLDDAAGRLRFQAMLVRLRAFEHIVDEHPVIVGYRMEAVGTAPFHHVLVAVFLVLAQRPQAPHPCEDLRQKDDKSRQPLLAIDHTERVRFFLEQEVTEVIASFGLTFAVRLQVLQENVGMSVPARPAVRGVPFVGPLVVGHDDLACRHHLADRG